MIKRLFFFFTLTSVFCAVNSQALTTDPQLPNLAQHKILIAYFSYSGNTEKMARQIHNLTAGVLFRIKGLDPYIILNKEEVQARAQKELEEDARPGIEDQVYRMATYDIIFLGYPIWESTLPMIMHTFLESYDFSNKIIIPFVTHDFADTAFAQSLEMVTKHVPNSIVFQGISTVKGATDRAFVLKHLKRIDKEVGAVSEKNKQE